VVLLLAALAASAMPDTALGQIYVVEAGNFRIGEYTTSGATMNAALVTGFNFPDGIAVSGGNLWVLDDFAGRIGEYNATTGAVVNASVVSGLIAPVGFALSGSNLFVVNAGTRASNFTDGSIGEYTTSGATVNASLVSGLNSPEDIAVSGSNLFVTNSGGGTIGEYNATTGATVNAALITGLATPRGIAVSGGNLFVSNRDSGSIGEYTTSGATVNAALVTGISSPWGIAVSGSKLFVVSQADVNIGPGSIEEYTTSGATVNAALVSGLYNPNVIAVVPEPSTFALAALGFAALAVWRLRRITSTTSTVMNRIPTSTLLFCAIPLVVLPSSAAAGGVTIAWSPVGNPGNPADTVVETDGTTGYGSVPYSYNIGMYDVTNSQYAAFLNTKDPTGVNNLGLWNSNMASAQFGGISFNAGNTNGSKYVLTAAAQNHPVNFVTWYDTLRFANWLNNGQGSGDTESGAYTLLGGTSTPSNGLSITRNAGATVFLPNENEWYKAAYYNPATSSYYQHPTSNNTVPAASGPTSAPNSANYDDVVGNLTAVGAYSSTASPYGAYDMGGNVFQWDEALISGSLRGLRGGSYDFNESYQLSSTRSIILDPTFFGVNDGFRVAMIPEPSTLILAAYGFAALTIWRLRR